MSTLKTDITYEDHKKGIFEKFWIVAEPETPLNFIGKASHFDPVNRNEERTYHGYSVPKYFESYAEARACAKFWNEKIPDKYYPGKLCPRHGLLCSFKPYLVQVCLAGRAK